MTPGLVVRDVRPGEQEEEPGQGGRSGKEEREAVRWAAIQREDWPQD